VHAGKQVALGLNINPGDINKTHHFYEFKGIPVPFYLDKYAIIPLPFYYSENIDISNETTEYTIPVDTRLLQSPEVYSVRFFVFDDPKKHWHITTQTILQI
jgi:hypothetical protein